MKLFGNQNQTTEDGKPVTDAPDAETQTPAPDSNLPTQEDSAGAEGDSRAAEGQIDTPPDSAADTPSTITQGEDNGPNALARRLDDADRVEKLNAKDDKVRTYTSEGPARDPSAEEAGISEDAINSAREQNGLNDTFSEVNAANHGATTGEVDYVIYSSHPIKKMHIGAYHFEDSILKLKPDQEAAFKELIAKLPAPEQMAIKKISLDRVAEIVGSRVNAATKAFDSSVGRNAMERMRTENQVVGVKPIDG